MAIIVAVTKKAKELQPADKLVIIRTVKEVAPISPGKTLVTYEDGEDYLFDAEGPVGVQRDHSVTGPRDVR